MTAAARMRRLRERERAGRSWVSIELEPEDVEMLIEARQLDRRLDHFTAEVLGRAVKNFLRIARDA